MVRFTGSLKVLCSVVTRLTWLRNVLMGGDAPPVEVCVEQGIE